MVGVCRSHAGARLDCDVSPQRLQLLDGLGRRGHARFMRPAFFENGDFHGALMIRWRRERLVRRTLHSGVFFAKPVFRRA